MIGKPISNVPSMRIVDKIVLKQSPLQRKAMDMLRKLRESNAIEVELNNVSSRTLRRAFDEASKVTNIPVRIKVREGRLYVTQKVSGILGE